MGRAKGMATQGTQELPYRTIVGNGIGDRLDTDEMEKALAVGAELAAQIHVALGRILLLIQTVLVGFPDIQQGMGDGRAVERVDMSADHSWLTSAVEVNRGTRRQFARACAIKGAKDCALGDTLLGAVVDGIYQHTCAGHIG